MGFLDFLPCCGRRDKADANETDPLIAPREGSITSQDAYGAVSMSASTTMDGSHVPQGALSTSAKERIDKIGREVGGNMLSINTSSRSHLRTARPPSPTDSAGSSRPPTPSPRRPEPEGGVMSPPPTASTIATEDMDSGSAAASEAGTGEGTTDGEVVKKTLFHGAAPGAPRNKKSKKKGAKGKGSRAKSKKQK